LLLFYSAFEYGFYVPDCGKAVLTEECNCGSYFDRAILGKKLMRDFWPCDPEGLFSTLTAVGTTFIGYTFSRIMRKYMNQDIF